MQSRRLESALHRLVESHAKLSIRVGVCVLAPVSCNAADRRRRIGARSPALHRIARSTAIVLAMIADPHARRVRETVAGLPRCVIDDAKRQVPEFNRPS
ncbi:hypothetical protein [Burkholderia pseudomultivorans]|uniref:hypothetical protein n=1 Tax=Burkholderia pseudomultivorans TaxID=1207504 RepID=UPI0012D869F8|nr:hypothetical protein [Burkholderia pseudomultivorans]